MAGHSQFANIKHRKNAQDAKRARLFTKLKRELIVAARLGGPDPDSNPRLKAACLAAKKCNMPGDKVKDAIASINNSSCVDYEEMTYGGFGPNGTAFFIFALTNNKNRTASDIRYIFSKRGGNLTDVASVSHLFEHNGILIYSIGQKGDYDSLFSAALDSGALDVSALYQDADDSDKYLVRIVTPLKDFAAVRDLMIDNFGDPEVARLARIPHDFVSVDDQGDKDTLAGLLDDIENHDDVQCCDVNFALE